MQQWLPKFPNHCFRKLIFPDNQMISPKFPWAAWFRKPSRWTGRSRGSATMWAWPACWPPDCPVNPSDLAGTHWGIFFYIFRVFNILGFDKDFYLFHGRQFFLTSYLPLFFNLYILATRSGTYILNPSPPERMERIWIFFFNSILFRVRF